jgi:hypothetical protein
MGMRRNRVVFFNRLDTSDAYSDEYVFKFAKPVKVESFDPIRMITLYVLVTPARNAIASMCLFTTHDGMAKSTRIASEKWTGQREDYVAFRQHVLELFLHIVDTSTDRTATAVPPHTLHTKQLSSRT